MHVRLNRNGMRRLKSQKPLFLQHLRFQVQNKAVTQKNRIIGYRLPAALHLLPSMTTKSTFMRMGDFVCTESHEVS